MERRMKFVRLVSVLTLFTFVVFGAFAGGREETEEVEEIQPSTEIVIYHWMTAGDEKTAIDHVINKFKAAYPDITAIENPTAGGEIMIVLEGLFFAGNPPDVCQVSEPARIANWVRAGLVMPVNDLWEELGLEEATDPSFIASHPAYKYEGRYYIIPELCAYESGIIYNKNIFNEVGIDPSTLTSVDALLDASAQIQAAGYTPFAIGSRWLWTCKYPFMDALLSLGGPEKMQAFYRGEITANDPVVRQSLEFVAATGPYTNSDHSARTWDEGADLIVQNKAAMYIHGAWLMGLLKTKGFKMEDMGIFHFPGLKDFFVTDGTMWMIPARAEHSDAAKKFLKILGSAEIITEMVAIRDGTVGWRRDIIEREIGPISKASLEIQKEATVVATSEYIEGVDIAFTSGANEIIQTLLIDGDVDAAVNAFIDLRNNVYGG